MKLQVVVQNNYSKNRTNNERIYDICNHFIGQTIHITDNIQQTVKLSLQYKRKHEPVVCIFSGSDKDPGENKSSFLEYVDILDNQAIPCILICYSMQVLAKDIDRHSLKKVYKEPSNYKCSYFHLEVEYYHEWGIVPTQKLVKRIWNTCLKEEENLVTSFRYKQYAFACQFHPESSESFKLFQVFQLLDSPNQHRVVCREFSLPTGSEFHRVQTKLSPRFNVFIAFPDPKNGTVTPGLVNLIEGLLVEWKDRLREKCPETYKRFREFLKNTAYLNANSIDVFLTWNTTDGIPYQGWPGKKELNSGYQPSGLPVVHICRVVDLRSVLYHELIHCALDQYLYLNSRYQNLLPHLPVSGLFKPMEGYVQFLTDYLLLERPDECLRSLLQNCKYLARVIVAHKQGKIEQTSDIFSYFFVRLIFWLVFLERKIQVDAISTYFKQLSLETGGIERFIRRLAESEIVQSCQPSVIGVCDPH